MKWTNSAVGMMYISCTAEGGRPWYHGLLYAESVRGRASQLMGIRYAGMVL